MANPDVAEPQDPQERPHNGAGTPISTRKGREVLAAMKFYKSPAISTVLRTLRVCKPECWQIGASPEHSEPTSGGRLQLLRPLRKSQRLRTVELVALMQRPATLGPAFSIGMGTLTLHVEIAVSAPASCPVTFPHGAPVLVSATTDTRPVRSLPWPKSAAGVETKSVAGLVDSRTYPSLAEPTPHSNE